jgi:hypothetical protein
MKKHLLFVQTLLFVLFFYNHASAQYCTPTFTNGCAGGYGITSFQFGDLNQGSILCEGTPEYYQDFTGISADFAQNGIYDISVQAADYGGDISIWIDYNNDEVFDNSTELVSQFFCPSFSTTSTSITIPGTANLAATRLRIMSSTNGLPIDPCFDPGYGNCCDFSVNIVAPVTAPFVSTFSATDISAIGAIFHGSINANSFQTHSRFNYGFAGSYTEGASGNPFTITGNTDTDVAATITGLVPSTLYNYELVGYGPGGSVSGGNVEFTTLSIPPTVETLNATEVSGISAILNANVNANNLDATVMFEYGFDDTYGSSVIGNPSDISGYSVQHISAPLTGLAMNSTYHYRVVSTNSEGTSYGNDMTFTTLETQYCIPYFNYGCSEFNIGLTYFELESFSQNIVCEGTPDYYHDYTLSTYTDLAKNGYYVISVRGGYGNEYLTVWIDYNQNNYFDGGSELIGNVFCNNNTDIFTIPFTVSAGALTGSTRLRATTSYYSYPSNACSSKDYGNCSDFTVNIVDEFAPPMVQTFDATGIMANGATLNGLINDNGNLTHAVFNYGLTTSYGNSQEAVPATVSGNVDTDISAAITGLSPNKTYHYEAVGYGAGGYVSGGDLQFTTDIAPPIVATETATMVSGATAMLNGTVNANNLSSDVFFEYGLDNTYGNTIDGTPSGLTGVSDVSVSAMIAGLELNTTYH